MAFAPRVWLDGEIKGIEQAVVPVTSMAVALAASVFEAVRAYADPVGANLYYFRLPDHIRRLGWSLKICRMVTSQTPDRILQGAIDVLRANGIRGDCYVRITAFCPDPPPGSSVFHPDGFRGSVVITVVPAPAPPPEPPAIHCCVSSWRRNGEGAPPRIKAAANYHNTRLAGFEAQVGGYDNAIMLNSEGRVAETGDATLFMVRGGCLVTPPCSAGVLEGITRASLLTMAGELGIAACERDIDRSELYVADEVFLANTARLIRPVGSIDRIPVGGGGMGPVTGLLCRRFAERVRALRGHKWGLPVYD